MTFGGPTLKERRAQRVKQRRRNLKTLATPSRALVRGSYAGTTAAPAPKSAPYRDRALLDMAQGRRCLLCVPGICCAARDTTVAAHSNMAIHGKAGARKADDCYSVWACHACHGWLDQGPAPADAKDLAFTLAHLDQVLAWRLAASDTAEPLRFRRAAQRALDRLGAKP